MRARKHRLFSVISCMGRRYEQVYRKLSNNYSISDFRFNPAMNKTLSVLDVFFFNRKLFYFFFVISNKSLVYFSIIFDAVLMRVFFCADESKAFSYAC